MELTPEVGLTGNKLYNYFKNKGLDVKAHIIPKLLKELKKTEFILILAIQIFQIY